MRSDWGNESSCGKYKRGRIGFGNWLDLRKDDVWVVCIGVKRKRVLLKELGKERNKSRFAGGKDSLGYLKFEVFC